MDSNQKVSDVIIVGAGLAGLAAAQVINQTELNYTVLEASDRAGGKFTPGLILKENSGLNLEPSLLIQI